MSESFHFTLNSSGETGFHVDTTFTLWHSEQYASEWSPGRRLSISHDSNVNAARALFMWSYGFWDYVSRMYTVVAPNHVTQLGNPTGGYPGILTVLVLPDSAVEQALGIRSNDLQILHIRNGQVWGTISIEAGFAEMKVIGRYQSERRRLVVRYGSELRIYRFGDPIYTDADDARPELPQELTLTAYPNPFNPTTMIAFDLPKAVRASLMIYELNGRQITTLFDEQMSAGRHEFGFDGANLPSGIYFARLNAGELVRTQKLVLLK